MPDVDLICDYCDTHWRLWVSANTQEMPKCPKCKVNHCTRVAVKKACDTDPFGYDKGKR